MAGELAWFVEFLLENLVFTQTRICTSCQAREAQCHLLEKPSASSARGSRLFWAWSGLSGILVGWQLQVPCIGGLAGAKPGVGSSPVTL